MYVPYFEPAHSTVIHNARARLMGGMPADQRKFRNSNINIRHLHLQGFIVIK